MPGHRMNSPLISRLDTQATWRAQLDRHVAGVARFLADHELSDPDGSAQLEALRRRLRADRLSLAFVAEFSRGKSELINAIFFADTGRRVLPATPGRTTMCPVELFHDPEEPASLSLLPIETRLEGLSLAELRGRRDAWQHTPLDPGNPESLAYPWRPSRTRPGCRCPWRSNWGSGIRSPPPTTRPRTPMAG